MPYSLLFWLHPVVKMEVEARDVYVKVIILLEVVLDRMFLYEMPSLRGEASFLWLLFFI